MASIPAHRDLPAEIRRTLHLAAPVMIGQLAVFSMNFVDTVMAGRLPERELALAALGTGGALWSAMLMLVIGLLLAVQPTVAQLDGAGRREEGGRVARQGTWLALGLAALYVLVLLNSRWLLTAFDVDPSIVPTAVAYLHAMAWGAPAICGVFLLRYFSEGSGRTRPTMYIGFIGVALNIPLNWVLMYGKLGMPALGAVGCGYATAIVLWAQFLVLLAYIARSPHYRPFHFFSPLGKPDRPLLGELLRVGAPIAVMIFMEGSLFVAAAVLIARLGALPSAAHLVAINFAALVFMIPLGLSSAVTIRVGNAVGRGEPAAARHAGVVGVLLALCISGCSATAMFLFPEAIVRIYTEDPEVIAVAAGLLFYAAVFQLSDGVQVVSAGGLRGLKDTRVPMIYTAVAYWAVGMPIGYHLTFAQERGPEGMWIGMVAGLTVAAALLLGRFLRSSGRLARARAPARAGAD